LWQSALAGVHYVDVNSTNATPPYTNWTTAATNIQDAVDVAVAGDEVVVTNGTYATGGRDYNRVEVDKPLSLRSVNGPQFTFIYGLNSNRGFTRCIYLTDGASLSGFTLSGGGGDGGGGALGGTLSNCTLSGNSAQYGGGADGCTLFNCTLTGNSAKVSVSFSGNDSAYGGGAAYCTLNNCTLSYNSAQVFIQDGGTGSAYGGGAYRCALNNCTLAANSAQFSIFNGGTGSAYGGGAYDCTLNNSIIYFNNADVSGANYGNSTLNYCCTTPQPIGGIGSITNAPLFGDLAGNLRLQPNSPCINAGNNSYVTNATDLDGNPRISGGRVDIGAYEFQWPQLTIAPSGPNVLLKWPTNNAGYDYAGFTLQSATNLDSPAFWSTNSPAPVVIAGQNTVTNPITGPQKFFRLSQ